MDRSRAFWLKSMKMGWPRSSFHHDVVTASGAPRSTSRASALPARPTWMKSQSVALRRNTRTPRRGDLLAGDGGGEALQMRRPIKQRAKHRTAGPRQVVLDQPALGALRPELGEIHLVPVGQPHRDAIDVELFCCNSHIWIPACRTPQ